jgi:hypothetical protein
MKTKGWAIDTVRASRDIHWEEKEIDEWGSETPWNVLYLLHKDILAIRREHRAHKDHSTSPAETTGCQVRFTLDRGRFFQNFRLAEAEHIGFEVFGREHETVDFSETLDCGGTFVIGNSCFVHAIVASSPLGKVR